MNRVVSSPIPFLEYRYGEKDIDRTIEGISNLEEVQPSISLAECAYHMGYYPEAIEVSDRVIAVGASSEAMLAQCVKMGAYLALGDSSLAWQTALEAKEACLEGLQSDDRNVFWIAAVCAGILEDVTLLSIQEAPIDYSDLGEMPIGIRTYYGYLAANKLYLQGEDLQAAGMAQGFLMSAGDQYPLSCVKLHLLMAAAFLRHGKVEKADDEYRTAWELANPLGIVTPFVEFSSRTPGLARRYLHDRDDALLSLVRSSVQRYRKGWFGLRDYCNQPAVGGRLSILEQGVMMLAAWGWSNKQIAAFLGISENTVKHYLTSVYQKLGVKSRSGLVALLSDLTPSPLLDN